MTTRSWQRDLNSDPGSEIAKRQAVASVPGGASSDSGETSAGTAHPGTVATQTSELERLRSENATLRALLETAYRRVELGVACDYVGFTPPNWYDFHATPDAAFAKWIGPEIDALLHVAKY